jgi:hypothetical protein
MTDLLRRRFDGTFTVDEWGLDRDLVHLTAPFFGLRWSIATDGTTHIPDEGPAVLLFTQQVGLSEPLVVPRGVRLATGRHLRVAGVIDIAPAGTVLRRLGGVLADPDEIAGLIRAGELVGLGFGRQPLHRGGTEHFDVDLLAPAVEAGVPVLPCLVRGFELGRRWKLQVAPPVTVPSRQRRNPDAVLAMARAEIERMASPPAPDGDEGHDPIALVR